MSAHGYTDDPTPAQVPAPARRNPTPRKIITGLASAAAIGAIAFGASAVVNSTNDTASTNAAVPQAQAAAASQAVPGGTPPAGAAHGAPPPGITAVTGSTLTKLEALATATYPGTVERAIMLSDGSYIVHVIKSDGSGEVHVRISKELKVTGAQTGGPRGGPRPGAGGQAPPQGQTPSSAGTGTLTQS
ncbi:MAG: hypothetical protein QOI42_160 [Frankiaceae bacterium]|nr:hypothetical protein [Frankiaceae bacterium]